MQGYYKSTDEVKITKTNTKKYEIAKHEDDLSSFKVKSISFVSDNKEYQPTLYFDDDTEYIKWKSNLEDLNMH